MALTVFWLRLKVSTEFTDARELIYSRDALEFFKIGKPVLQVLSYNSSNKYCLDLEYSIHKHSLLWVSLRTIGTSMH